MRDARTFDGVLYAPGRRFRVTQPAALMGMVPVGSNVWQGWKQDLKPGDEITCLGYGPGWGSDPGYGIEWSSDQALTVYAIDVDFWPHHPQGGPFAYRPAPGYLEPIGVSDDEIHEGITA